MELQIGAANSWSSSCGRQSVDQYVWVSGLPLGSLTRFYLALLLSFDRYVVLLSMRPLWRENGSVIYCTIASGPCQSNHTWAEVPQNSRQYLTVSSETPPTWSWSWSMSCSRQSTSKSGYRASFWDPWPDFYLALLSFDNYVVLLSMRPLWRENG
jgi:hypothetical protein